MVLPDDVAQRIRVALEGIRLTSEELYSELPPSVKDKDVRSLGLELLDKAVETVRHEFKDLSESEWVEIQSEVRGVFYELFREEFGFGIE